MTGTAAGSSGSGLALVVAGLVAVVAWLLAGPRPGGRRLTALARAGLTTTGPDRVAGHVTPTGGPSTGDRGRSLEAAGSPRTVLAAVAAGLATALLVGGVGGAAAGVVVAVGVRLGVARLEPRAARERRTALVRQAPEVADLLAACLASGAPLGAAVDAVARAVGPPAAGPLRTVVATLDLGGDPVAAWQSLGAEPGLVALSRAVSRSLDSGAPLGDVLPGIADDLRRSARVEAETAARAAGVKAVAPLAACFLPAFLLLGVVPVVASLADALLTGS